GDPDAAELCARGHIRKAGKRLEAWLARRNGKSGPQEAGAGGRGRGPAALRSGVGVMVAAEEVTVSPGDVSE
ncbi:MAG: hypothetical protein AB7Y46_09655, partial [Armatimonadota bacterium]